MAVVEVKGDFHPTGCARDSVARIKGNVHVPIYLRHTRLRADAGLHPGVPQPVGADSPGCAVSQDHRTLVGAVHRHRQRAARAGGAEAELWHRLRCRRAQWRDRHAAGLGAGALSLPRPQDHRADDRPAFRPSDRGGRHCPHCAVRAERTGRPVRHADGLQDRLQPAGHHPGTDLRHPALRPPSSSPMPWPRSSSPCSPWASRCRSTWCSASPPPGA